MKKYTTGHRLRQIMAARNLRQVDILELAKPYCEKYGEKLTKSDLSQYVNEKVTPGQIKTQILAMALDVNESWLMGYDVPMERDFKNYVHNILPLPQTKKVPLLGDIACGVPILAVENVAEYVDMDTDIHADFALRCNGDSMINARIFDGDIVYIRQHPEVENGEFAAVLIGTMDTEATLKRVYRTEDSLRLCAENPSYKDIVFFKEEINSVRILGKAVAFLSAVR